MAVAEMAYRVVLSENSNNNLLQSSWVNDLLPLPKRLLSEHEYLSTKEFLYNRRCLKLFENTSIQTANEVQRR